MGANEFNLVAKLYTRFNARDIDGIFELLQADVSWANGMDGGYVRGLNELRAYWTQQWEKVSPKVTPKTFQPTEDGIVVSVQQQISAHDGSILFDGAVRHAFSIRNGKIARFDILADSRQP